MNSLITRWKPEPSYPKPFSPVARARKFSTVCPYGQPLQSSSETLSFYLWHSVSIKTNDDSALVLAVNGNVEEDLLGDLGSLLRFGGLGEKDESERGNQQQADCDSLDASHGGQLIQLIQLIQLTD